MSDSEDEFYSSGDESTRNPLLINKSKKKTAASTNAHSDSDSDSDNDMMNGDDDDQDEIDDADITKTIPKSTKSNFNQVADDEISDDNDEVDLLDIMGVEDDENDNPLEDDDELEKSVKTLKKVGVKKVKKLTEEQIEKEQKKIKRTGVVYMSSIPPYMKPAKIRHIMSRFGTVDRIYLKPEDSSAYKSRIKQGGNKKKKFDEGWVEFTLKKDAKLAANTLNGNILGGKKRSFYHDDVMNVKYLSGFKWFDLTNALNRELEVRESKKQAELSQATKINKQYIRNVEQSKNINRIEKQKQQKRKSDEVEDMAPKKIQRNFRQKEVSTHRANADDSIKAKSQDKISGILDKIF
ncbi:RNA-binding ATPase activator [Martiniozyma asiatica (nom. inval.)]|nr:RNA-binding ATPase activator [Martiniozyma asiatica]